MSIVVNTVDTIFSIQLINVIIIILIIIIIPILIIGMAYIVGGGVAIPCIRMNGNIIFRGSCYC